ncbi:serine/threonine protein kinase [hydrothermal vent metagenome]|uniref:Serine/threonine protein kinase n=1 Tax=hydrothermal vent metagenome TaxID=652676 RepID=A0A1W1EHR6_9ZZZZ
MNSKTIIEQNSKTIIEGTTPDKNSNLHISTFQDYSIIKQFPTTGGEADIYLIEKDNQKYILKLYRFGIEPKSEIVEKLKFLSLNYPKDIIKIYDIALDTSTKRWYEIQEYIEFGSLEEFKESKLTQDELKDILVEISQMLHSIHSQNIIHRDLKPQNILIRKKSPLNLVITDFGISSLLDSELSKRMTSKSGTKIYFAPESFSGVIGREVDYWALGMILLELASGDNIFKELDENYIAYTISTKNIPIPKDIDSDFSYLIKGLLTRNPDNRWGYNEIVRWLKGDRDIALEYYSSDGEYEKPYLINGKKYYDLSELVTLFAINPKMWQEGKAHLNRGYITKWCENNGDFDRSIKIDELKKLKDSDFALFKLIYTYNHNLDFIIAGKLINSQNLMLFMGKYIKGECSNVEESIVHLTLSNKIMDYYSIFKDSTKKDDDFEKILKTIIDYYKNNNIYAMEKISDIMQFLKVAIDKDKYYFSYNILMADEKLLINREDFDRVNHRFTLPQYIIDMIDTLKFNRRSIKYLKKLLDFDYQAYYLPIDFNERLNSDFEDTIDKLEQFIKKDILDKELKDNFLPNSFRDKIRDLPFDEYLEYLTKLKRLERLNKSQFQKLQATYYMPKIDRDIQEFEEFASQIGFVNDLMIDGLLIEKEIFNSLSDFIPQDIQKSIKSGKYDLSIAKEINKLKEFDMQRYILPDNFTIQIQNNFSKVIDNLENFLSKELYKNVFIPKRLNELLLSSSFTNYINISKLINDTQMQKEDILELQNDKPFLDTIKLNLDDINKLDEKDLKFIKKIRDANIDRKAYVQMIEIYDEVMKSKSDKIKKYFKELKSLNSRWNNIDTKIINYIYNHKINIRTTYESTNYKSFSHFFTILSKISLAITIFLIWSSREHNIILYFTILAIYIPIITITLFNDKDIKFIQIYTNPFQIVLNNIERNDEFIRRVNRVIK